MPSPPRRRHARNMLGALLRESLPPIKTSRADHEKQYHNRWGLAQFAQSAGAIRACPPLVAALKLLLLSFPDRRQAYCTFASYSASFFFCCSTQAAGGF